MSISIQNQCEIQERMLNHFGIMPPKMSYGMVVKAKRLPRKTELALTVSDIFFNLSDDFEVHGIQSADDAINEIRYSMGFSWLAWMFARYFITELIKWLWAEYHKEPISEQSSIPTGSCTSSHSCCTKMCQKSDEDLNSELR